MSLYGDLPQAKDGDTPAKQQSTGWAAKKMQPAFRTKAVNPSSAGSSVLAVPAAVRAAAAAAAVGGGGRGGAAAAGGRGGAGGPASAGRGGAPSTAAAPQPAAVVHTSASSTIPALAHTPAAAPAARQQHASSVSFLCGADGAPLQDEYDPARPNDFEDIIKRRRAAAQAAEEAAEAAARQREADQDLERRRREQAEAAAALAAAEPSTAGAGLGSAGQLQQASTDAAALAGPGPGSAAAAASADPDEYERERQRRLKMSGEEAFLARGRRSSGVQPSAAAAAQPAPGLAPPPAAAAAAAGAVVGERKGMGLAQKLLEKMGWREGQGLGRHRQGMATPLVAQKTAANAGVIVAAELPPDAKRPRPGAAFSGPPTRVVVLRNMVGPGEVDEDLEEEVGNELTKHGTVEDVMIFEVTMPGWPAEEAVRIFVKFDRVEAATRALVDLQGRFFGGREVRAAFFSEDRFAQQQLAPQAGEFGEGAPH